jgi:hypothetical protein
MLESQNLLDVQLVNASTVVRRDPVDQHLDPGNWRIHPVEQAKLKRQRDLCEPFRPIRFDIRYSIFSVSATISASHSRSIVVVIRSEPTRMDSSLSRCVELAAKANKQRFRSRFLPVAVSGTRLGNGCRTAARAENTGDARVFRRAANPQPRGR